MQGNSGDGAHTHGNPLDPLQAPVASQAPVPDSAPVPDWPDAHGSAEFALAAELAAMTRLAQAQRADALAMAELVAQFYPAPVTDAAPDGSADELALITFYRTYHVAAPRAMLALAQTPQIVNGAAFPLSALIHHAESWTFGDDAPMAPVFASLLDRGYLELDAETGKVRRGAEFGRMLELVGSW